MSSRRTRTPPAITGDELAGRDEIPDDLLLRLLVNSNLEAGLNLIEGWNKKVVALISCKLDSFNKKPASTNLLLQGAVCEGVKAKTAARFWPIEDNTVLLHIKPFEAGLFKFPNGLTSDFVDSSEVNFGFKNGNADIPPSQLNDLGISGFALRANVQPCQPAGWAKLAINLFPMDKKALLQRFQSANDPSFPGLNIFKGMIEINPTTASFDDDCSWGAPFLPAIIPGANFNDAPLDLNTNELRNAVFSLLRQAKGTECKSNQANLEKRWSELEAANAKELPAIQPDFLWPSPSLPVTVNLGKMLFKCLFAIYQGLQKSSLIHLSHFNRPEKERHQYHL